MNRGVVIRGGSDEVIKSRARRAGLGVAVMDGWTLPFEQTLVVEAGTRVPWDLLPAAWHFLQRWDAAVPLWRYGVLAADVGTAEEREMTRAVVHDLRVLLHSVELLFVNTLSGGGCDLYLAWADEVQKVESGDRRLAFLRAVYQVKPRLCVLPTTWLAEVRQWQADVTMARRQPIQAATPMVVVEIEPGRVVKCHAGDEERVRTLWKRQTARQVPSEEKVTMAVVSGKSFVFENQKTRQAKGPLVRVQIGNRWVKMHEADAIAAGHLAKKEAEPTKARPAQADKLRPATGSDKAAPEKQTETPPADQVVGQAVSFETIDGVGPATARRIVAQGITTYDQLRQANLDFLSGPARQAIEAWSAEPQAEEAGA